MSETTCPKPECIDSPLVTTGTIMGILTFIYALFIGLLFTYIKLRTLYSELDETILSYESTCRQLASLRLKLNYYNDILPSKPLSLIKEKENGNNNGNGSRSWNRSASTNLREELYVLFGDLKRCEDIINDKVMRKMVSEVGDYGHFDRFKQFRALVKGHAVLDALRGRVRGAQAAVGEVQVGLIQLKQDVIHADQIARSNVLFNILVDPGKRYSGEEIACLRERLQGDISMGGLGKNDVAESVREKDGNLSKNGSSDAASGQSLSQ